MEHPAEHPAKPARRTRESLTREAVISLSSKQRAHLRSLAHSLSAVLQVGAEGVSDPVVEAVEQAFRNRELLKVKVLDGAPGDVDETADALRDRIDGVEVVQTIGKTMVLFRRHPEDPRIELPS